MANTYLAFFIGSAVLLSFVVLTLYYILKKSRNSRKFNTHYVSLSAEELEEHAKKIAIEHTVTKKRNTLNWPVPRMNDNFGFISSVYRGLNEDVSRKKTVPSSAEWLLDNFYIIEEQVKGLRRDLSRTDFVRLPLLRSGRYKGYARILAVALELAANTDVIDEKVISDYLKTYQSDNVLFDREIWAVPVVMRLALIENIRYLCENVKNTQQQWRKADKFYHEWLYRESAGDNITAGMSTAAGRGAATGRSTAAGRAADMEPLIKLLKDNIKKEDGVNPSFIEHLLYLYRRSGRSYTEIVSVIDENLAGSLSSCESAMQITQEEHSAQSVNTVSMGNCITSLRSLAKMDWGELFESASHVEQILRQDPDGTYPLMDMATRNYYRGRIEKMALIYGIPELQIAREAIGLAEEAYNAYKDTSSEGVSSIKADRTDLADRSDTVDIPDESDMADGVDGIADTDGVDPEVRRKWHVGYYLIGKGIGKLEGRQKSIVRFMSKTAVLSRKIPGILYLGSIGIITLLLTAMAMQYAVHVSTAHVFLLTILSGIAVLVPLSEIAVSAVNLIVCKTLKPAFFPRLELKEGIPPQMSTIVAVPTLLPDEKRVEELLGNLESHYLCNRDENLYFALIGAFKDSDTANAAGGDDIVRSAMRKTEELNRKYSTGGRDKFYYFHRESQYNEKNNKWFGWERKRGALMEFNDLVLGSANTGFSYMSCDAPPFSDVRYIITLDSDTILPMGMARKMVGTMAHPLNKPLIDRQRGIVTGGYGIMQPRIDVENESSNKSLFSRIFTGQEGIDPYANAISDVYQDMFGEGIFTGKGIYDLKAFQSILKNTIQEDAILSHDLLEGSYMRTGLVADLRLADSFPSKYNSYSDRLHRWVRGDWQLFPMLSGRIPDHSSQGRGNDQNLSNSHNHSHGRSHSRSRDMISNPLSLLSRWKMLDNLRRSLVAPALMLLVVLGYCVLPGNIYFWLGIFFAVQAFPFITALMGYLLSGRFGSYRVRRYMPVMHGLKSAFLQGLLNVIFLPYQALLALNAVTVTLTRVFFTRKNLLEWVTSADIEKLQKNTLSGYYSKMKAAVWTAAVFVILAAVFGQSALITGLVLSVLWAASPMIAFLISRDIKAPSNRITGDELKELGRIARKTWRYFEEFTNIRSHYLIPDNYQADPPKGLAHRTSPTNIGLGLLSVLTARDLGYIGTCEMTDFIDKIITTVEELEKWNGHLYNWYDTRTLKPLMPAYISTVDSGNLAGYLIVLRQGLLEYLHKPLPDTCFANGIRDTLHCAGEGNLKLFEAVISGLVLPDPVSWNEALDEIIKGGGCGPEFISKTVWRIKIEHMVRMFKNEITEFMPWIDLLGRMPAEIVPEMAGLTGMFSEKTDLCEMPDFCRKASQCATGLIEIKREKKSAGAAWLIELREVLDKAAIKTEQFIKRYSTLIDRADALTTNMKFLPLYNRKKHLFSIGYNIDERKLTNSYYDLLASEARQTSYMCIARGELPASHWFAMGRALTVVDRYKGLISWTGTMFEYLMPLLVMKSYRNTLLDETYSFVIKSQKKYALRRNMPWGTSESCYNVLDIANDYQYKAIGVPWLGLKRGLMEDAVAAPYATFLALLVNPGEAVKNIRYLKEEGLDGAYGFYESADYTPERLLFETRRTIVKSFMAHHQGMSLLAINNFLNNNVMQKRFHEDPAINAARLLLQEKVPVNIVITKETKEKVLPFKGITVKEKNSVRRFGLPDQILPKAHILTNGNYSVMITDRGTGYSRNKLAAVTRWREDRTLDMYGMFFYIRDIETGKVWSAAYSPLNAKPDKYEVVFTSDKALFKRTDGQIETDTEVTVASGDNVELRRISIKNMGDSACTLEVTSYYELVLAEQASDVAHPAFGNLFIETALMPEMNCIIANRRPRAATDKCLWAANAVVIEGNGAAGKIEFETDRMKMIGRGHNVKAPAAMENGGLLTGTAGAVLDPIMSIRAPVKIEAGKTARITFITAVSESNEVLLSLIEKYTGRDSVEIAFRLAFTRSQVETGYLNLEASEIELYQDAISHILFISPVRKMYREIIMQNKEGQSSLWRYGISGDVPIVLVVLHKPDCVEILHEVLKAHEYWHLKDLKTNLVILSEEEYSYTLPLYAQISDIIMAGQTQEISCSPKDIFVLDKNKITDSDIFLLYAAARIILKGDGKTFREQLDWNVDGQTDKTAANILSGDGGTQGRQSDNVQDDLQNNREQDTQPGREGQLTIGMKYHVSSSNAPGMKNISELLYYNGLGGFDKDRNEYVIRLDNGRSTPAPWVNVIANPNFGFMVSETGAGYTWYGNSRENKLTPWSNDPVSDSPGEVLYIGDRDSGGIWTATPLAVRNAGLYTIRHGFGYSVFEHAGLDFTQKLTQFVPVNDPVKVSILALKNLTDRKKRLTLTYYIRPVLGASDQAASMHIKSSMGGQGTLFITNTYTNEGFAGGVCFIDASITERSVTADRGEFFGSGDTGLPECLSWPEKNLSGTLGTGFDPCVAIQVKITLGKNENREIIFLLGMADNLQDAEAIAKKYRRIKVAKAAFNRAAEFWREKTGIMRVVTPDPSMDLMLNGWLQYQVISCRMWARSGFYQSGGALGFRDQLQDCLALMHLQPEISRAQILLHAGRQYIEGDVQHWWHEPTGKGIRTRFSDDFLWLPYVTAEYVRITGDKDIMQEMIPYIQEPLLGESEYERFGKPAISSHSGSLYEHCVRAIENSMKFGSHGLPLMGTGDWNDGMNMVGNKGQGESVWLGWFLAAVLEKFSQVCLMMGKDEAATADRYIGIRRVLTEAVEKNAWDGMWYRRAYFDDGQPMGSAQNDECMIDSIAQTWAVISGAGDLKRAEQAIDSLEDNLVCRDTGLIKLLTPPFDKGSMEPGYIKGYVPGVRENGGQYTHAAAWVVIAFACLGDGNKAYEMFKLINPVSHTSDYDSCIRYKTEPYVMTADVYSENPHAGRGGWSWYTGSAGWMYRAGAEHILGFKKEGETIVMDPCIPCEWKEYVINYKYRTSTYHIKVLNPDGKNKGVKGISQDGAMTAGNTITLADDGRFHEIEVVMGESL